MPYYSTLGDTEYTSEDNVNAKYGVAATDYIQEKQIKVDGKPFSIVLILRSSKTDAAGLNDAAAYAALPNGSMAICGTTTVKVAYKGAPDGKFDSVWA